jgi:Fe-S-cluster containining protein
MTGQRNIKSSQSALVALAGPLEPPKAPALARGFEKRIIEILQRLIKRSHPSCIDQQFRSEYDKALLLFSRYQDAVLSHYTLKMTCRPGCGVCCYHWPEDTYSFEVRFIASYLKHHRKSELKTITDRLREDIAYLEKTRRTVKYRLSDPAEKAVLGDFDPYDLVLSSFYRCKRPCPLLTKDGLCSIHPIRPFACRVYISFSAKEYCRPSRILSDKALTYLLDLEQDASDLFDRLHFMYDIFDGDTSFRSMLYKALTC